MTRTRKRPVRAFTLVEIVVVVAIIALLAAVVIPSVTSMWEKRKEATAENNLRSALNIARRRALTPGRGESGLLFVVDERGTQRVFQIEQQAVRDAASFDATFGGLLSRDRFVILEDRESVIPSPMRFVPRRVVEREDGPNKAYTYNTDELANNAFPVPAHPTWDEGQRQRNHFTMIFSTDGRLLEGRNVLIVDENKDDDEGPPALGDRTGLPIADNVAKYYSQESVTGATSENVDPSGSGARLSGLVSISVGGGSATAINFPSVDGVLLYNDAVFNQQQDKDSKREMLIRFGQPLYVTGSTGSLVRGAVGENVVPES